MFDTFSTSNISISPTVTIHTLTSPPNGPPLLLIHGFPQTHHIWHLVTPALVDRYTVILVDLPGYGQSSKPPSTPDHEEYSKSTLAQHLVTLMQQHLSHPTFSILAHDRGARVAHQLAINHPTAVSKLMLLDILPTLSMYTLGRHTWYQKYWHWQFLSQPAPFPESLILGNPGLFSEKFFGKNGVGGQGVGFDERVRGVYESLLTDEETVRGMCEDYRAGAGVDLQEQRADREAGRKIKCEVLVVWGGKGAIATEFEDPVGIWREVCEGPVRGESVDGGHYVPEEFPEDVVRLAKEFFV
ncbi:Epoxide hydrolase protein [Rutstroemia sp. NJR-2017a BBW]|nr:Epoxide hydrolase protein [Rutstroemia sp. NJR-2017a BBW]